MELPNGSRESNVLSAGNHDAALQRAQRNAAVRGARVVEGPIVVEADRSTA